MRLIRKWGVILLSAWLIIQGLTVLFSPAIQRLPELMAVLAVAAGVLLLLDR